ncbi:MAG: hypothetical protein N2510_09570 [Ignavibacteria bacterium]|nr:hypothetical protein [Ignavibacteria bacterium]
MVQDGRDGFIKGNNCMRLIVILISFLFTSDIFTSVGSFTLSAQVERSLTVNIEKNFVMNYIQDLKIYPKFFPDVVSVRSLNETDSEWIYKVEAPLAPAYNLIFILQNKSTGDTLTFESTDKEKDYLYCRSVIEQISETKTKVSFIFKISITREKASDIHFLAGVLGEKFLSERMKEKLEDDLETFISKAIKDMYIARRTSAK